MLEGAGKETVEELHQRVLAWLDRLKELIEELRDESEIEIKVIFKHKGDA